MMTLFISRGKSTIDFDFNILPASGLPERRRTNPTTEITELTEDAQSQSNSFQKVFSACKRR